MKTLILSKKGGGSTTYIKNKLIPELEKFRIFDFTGEYSAFNQSVHLKGLNVKETEGLFILFLTETPKDTTLIIDGACCFLNPKPDETSYSFKWLRDLIDEHNAIISFQSIRQFWDVYIHPNQIKKIVYLGETNDSDEIKNDFKSITKPFLEEIPSWRKTLPTLN